MALSLDAVAGGVVGEIPGSPGGVLAVADSWRAGARVLDEAASGVVSSRIAVPSWQGVSAEAFCSSSRGLDAGLDASIMSLLDGARHLEAYAQVLADAKEALERLRSLVSAALLEAVDAAAPEVLVAGVRYAAAGAAVGIRARVSIAAMQTAAALNAIGVGAGSGTGAGGVGAHGGGGVGAGKGKDDGTGDKTAFSDEDIRRLRRQADGSADWDPVDQADIGDCYFLATLDAYSLSEDGEQFLRDHVRWSEEDQAFIVTLYNFFGFPVEVKVTDYYTNGNQGDDLGGGRRGPNLMSVYERAYGQYLGDHNLPYGMPGNAMRAISGQYGPPVVDTRGTSGLLGAVREDHKYTDEEWAQIEQAVKDGRPVVAGTGGDFSDGSTASGATANTDADVADRQRPDAAIDGRDRTGDYQIVEGHAYTVIAIDDEYVTLRNPWAHNNTADGSDAEDDGIIRITREDYEKYFNRTDIGEEIP
ncbi:C2 family cysteine protease [Actinomyces ruminicola]|uniref:Calpain family cysteine protease n=1 Tax=Actinomyces ruminicola TaxID=332524 RepID=A0A1H0AGL8_9ACTO|nr:C2 family cysteine protease [Actinomyces ruminicola]SDN32659.1 Calpain family cysteine protease [Actinomyces ruminicola]